MKIIENILYSTLPRNYLERGYRDRQSPWARPRPSGPPHWTLLFLSLKPPQPLLPEFSGLSLSPLVCGLPLGYSPLLRHSLAMCVCVCVFKPFWPHPRKLLASLPPAPSQGDPCSFPAFWETSWAEGASAAPASCSLRARLCSTHTHI